MTRKRNGDSWFKDVLDLTERTSGIILDSDTGYFTTKKQALRKFVQPRRAQGISYKVTVGNVEPGEAKTPLESEFAKFKVEVREEAEKMAREPEILKRFHKTTDRWIVRDYDTRDICLLAYASAYTDDPANVTISGRAGIGKSYTAVNVSKLVPEKHIVRMGHMSPTALAHSYGRFDKTKNAFVVDLSKTILLMLDTPHPETLAKLKPILSHDASEITYKVTEKSKEGRQESVTTLLHGFPAYVQATARPSFDSEYSSRWLTITPEISGEKTEEAIMKAGERAENPERETVDFELESWKEYFEMLSEHAPITVKIPYGRELARHFLKRGPESMRVFMMFQRLIKAHAALHAFQRGLKGNSGEVAATVEDLRTVLPLFKSAVAPTFLGMSGDALLLGKALAGEKALSFERIAMKASELFGGEVQERTLRGSYITPLVEAGFLSEYEKPEDRRRKLYDAKSIAPEVRVFDDEEALFATIEGRPYNPSPQREQSAPPPEKDKDWIKRQMGL
jgi:hypothetical protein